MLEGQPPTDFHTGREMGAESWDCKSSEPDKRCYTRHLDSPKPKPRSLKSFLDAIDHRVALNWTEGTPEEFHNSRIGIHCGERFPILVTPSTQADAAAGQCHKGAHRCTILCLKTCSGEPAAGHQRRSDHVAAASAVSADSGRACDS